MTNEKELRKKWENEEKEKFSGWDFSYLKRRLIREHPPWEYNKIAKELTKNSNSVLDMGTGGGELFSTFAPFPQKTVAAEGYKPNIPIARKKLEPFGIKVVEVDNVAKLPFEDEEFDLILNKHDAFNVKEVFRILKKEGIFLTQQVAEDFAEDLIEIFNSKRGVTGLNLEKAKKQVIDAGFEVIKEGSWEGKMTFCDVGALVYYLKAVPWTIPGFSVKRDFEILKKLQKQKEAGKELSFKRSFYLIKARKK